MGMAYGCRLPGIVRNTRATISNARVTVLAPRDYVIFEVLVVTLALGCVVSTVVLHKWDLAFPIAKHSLHAVQAYTVVGGLPRTSRSGFDLLLSQNQSSPSRRRIRSTQFRFDFLSFKIVLAYHFTCSGSL